MDSLLYYQMLTFWKQIPFFYRFSSDYKQRQSVLKVLHGESKRVIQMRRTEFEAYEDNKSSNNQTDDGQVFGAKRREAFLDSLLKIQRETADLTDYNIQEEVDTLIFAVSWFDFDFYLPFGY